MKQGKVEEGRGADPEINYAEAGGGEAAGNRLPEAVRALPGVPADGDLEGLAGGGAEKIGSDRPPEILHVRAGKLFIRNPPDIVLTETVIGNHGETRSKVIGKR